ncbi:MAG: DUF4159 domain-containing protein [bacterium]
MDLEIGFIKNPKTNLIFWTLLFLLSPTLATSENHPNPQRWLPGDRLEWHSLYLDSNPKTNRTIKSVRAAIEGRTTIRMSPQQQWSDWLTFPILEKPFLHVPLCFSPPELTIEEKWRWRDFFAGGGTLMLDHCSSQSPMIEEDWVLWSNLLFPESSWETMSRSHVLSYSFYLLEKKMLLGNEGVPIRLLEQDGRFIMIWNRSKRFSWETMMRNQVRINPNPTDIETGLRFYVNLAMYLLTGDYKTDQLHLPTILLRRK